MFFSPRSAGKKLHLSSIINSQYDAHRDNVVVGSGVGRRTRNVRAALCRRSASSTCRCTVLVSDEGFTLESSKGFVVKGYISGASINVYAFEDKLPLPPFDKWIKVAETQTNSYGLFKLQLKVLFTY